MNNEIQRNLQEVKSRIKAACERANRNPEEVTLIAVSKTKPPVAIQAAYDAGQRVFGENKVQEITQKHGLFPREAKWHMIGHLQRNKVKQLLPCVSLIHSVDSVRLAEEIDKESEKLNKVSDILIEVNIANEISKYGVSPENVVPLIEEIHFLKHIRVRGLMTVAPICDNSEENRKYFRQMKQLAVDIMQQNIDNISMDILSMGMTSDYETAIEEGATMVRVGTGIFGERNYNR